MLKQSLILAGSVCLVAIVATASQDNPVAETVVETPAAPAPKPASKAPDPWAADDDYYAESESDDFTFGEPLVYNDDGTTSGTKDNGGDDGDIQRATADKSSPASASVAAATPPTPRAAPAQSTSSGPVKLGRPVTPPGTSPPPGSGPPVPLN